MLWMFAFFQYDGVKSIIGEIATLRYELMTDKPFRRLKEESGNSDSYIDQWNLEIER